MKEMYTRREFMQMTRTYLIAGTVSLVGGSILSDADEPRDKQCKNFQQKQDFRRPKRVLSKVLIPVGTALLGAGLHARNIVLSDNIIPDNMDRGSIA